MNISDANFWDAPNRAGLPTFSFTELVAALQGAGVGGSPFIGQGAGVNRPGPAQSIPTGAGADVIFTVEDYDDLEFFNLAAPTDLVIPITSPQISVVMVSGYTGWNNTLGGQSGIRQMDLQKNGAFDGLDAEGHSTTRYAPPDNGAIDGLYTFTGQPRRVVAGDVFRLRAQQTSAANPLGLNRAQMSIVVLK